MKTLDTEFVSGDGGFAGPNVRKYTQVKRTDKVAFYKRTIVSSGNNDGFEVFEIKVKPKGTQIFQKTLEDDEESYPSTGTFGKTAWYFGGVNAEKRALNRFEELVNGKVQAPETEDNIEETRPVLRVVQTENVVKRGRGRPARPSVTLLIPEVPFSQKDLAAHNGIENYKEVYTKLQEMINTGLLKRHSLRPALRGKPATLWMKA